MCPKAQKKNKFRELEIGGWVVEWNSVVHISGTPLPFVDHIVRLRETDIFVWRIGDMFPSGVKSQLQAAEESLCVRGIWRNRRLARLWPKELLVLFGKFSEDLTFKNCMKSCCNEQQRCNTYQNIDIVIRIINQYLKIVCVAVCFCFDLSLSRQSSLYINATDPYLPKNIMLSLA